MMDIFSDEFEDIENYYDDDSILEAAAELQKNQLVELVKAAKTSLNAEVKKELETLRKENAELTAIKNSYEEFNKLKDELAHEKIELERQKSKLKEEVEKEYAHASALAIIKKVFLPYDLYEVATTYVKQPKCDLCDDNRMYHITTPDGVSHPIQCSCSASMKKFYVDEVSSCSFTLRKDYSKKEFNPETDLRITYNKRYDDDCFSEAYDFKIDKNMDVADTFSKDLYDEEALFSKHYYFTNKEAAQAYADYCNIKELEKIELSRKQHHHTDTFTKTMNNLDSDHFKPDTIAAVNNWSGGTISKVNNLTKEGK